MHIHTEYKYIRVDNLGASIAKKNFCLKLGGSLACYWLHDGVEWPIPIMVPLLATHLLLHADPHLQANFTEWKIGGHHSPSQNFPVQQIRSRRSTGFNVHGRFSLPSYVAADSVPYFPYVLLVDPWRADANNAAAWPMSVPACNCSSHS